MRQIFGHHDGHGLTEAITILADEAGPGGASHAYTVYVQTARSKPEHHGEQVASIQYQRGPRNEEGSTPGVLDSVLLAIVADRMRSFANGPYACHENERVLSRVEDALFWLKHRADERAARGVLGKNIK